MLRNASKKLTLLTRWAESPPPHVLAVLGQRQLSSATVSGSYEQSQSFNTNREPFGHFHGFIGAPHRGFSASSVFEDGKKDTVLHDDTFQLANSEAFAPAATDDSMLGPDSISYVMTAAEGTALAEAWDDAYFINKGFQFLIQYFHGATGTPWWQSIAMATIVCRVATLPLVIKQFDNTARMSRAKPELEELNAWFQEKTKAGLKNDYKMEYQQRMAVIWKKHGFNPLKTLMPLLIQAPVFIGFFGALRSMASAQVPSMVSGGLPVTLFGLDYSNLTIADPYYTLPILSSLIFLISIELNAADGMQGQDEATLKRTKNLMRIVAVGMVYLTASMPMSVFCYWITSNCYTLVQSSVLKLDSVRRFFKLPTMEEMSKYRKKASTVPIPAGAMGPVQSFTSKPRVAAAELDSQGRDSQKIESGLPGSKSTSRRKLRGARRQK